MLMTLPTPDSISRTFTNLLGRQVSAKRGVAPAGAAKAQAVAVYSTATAPVAGICVVDLPLACSLGAGLSMIPPAIAAQSVRTGKIAENLLENFIEVMNVGAAMLSAGGQVRLALAQVYPPGPALPAEVSALLAKPAGRVDFDVAVTGYEAGKMAFLSS